MPQTIKRTLATVIVLGAAALAVPAPGQAEVLELGRVDEGVVPSCPGEPCEAIARTSGFQKRVVGEEDLYAVPQNGRIVAWSMTLADPTQKQIDYFDDLVGEAAARLTVFRMSKRKKERGIATVVGESGLQELTGFMGQTVQFPMANTIRVRKGDRIGLTIPTWAPVLALGRDRATVWRSTRAKADCGEETAPSAIEDVGTKSPFECGYRAAQMTYMATMVTQPRQNRSAREENARRPRR